MFIRHRAAVLPAAVALIAGIAACSDSVGPTGGRAVRVAFSTAASDVQGAVSRSPSYDVVITNAAGDSLVIDTVQVVLREIELESAVDACAAADGSAAGDDCPELSVGPMLVSLPLSGGVGSPLTAAVPAGTYRAIELELHRVSSDDSSDAAFVAAHPELADASVRVSGTYRGNRFVFTSEVNAEMELAFDPPVVVDAATANVTVHVDVASWFRDANGNIIAPTAANASRIANRIQASFRAFEDDDRDGIEN